MSPFSTLVQNYTGADPYYAAHMMVLAQSPAAAATDATASTSAAAAAAISPSDAADAAADHARWWQRRWRTVTRVWRMIRRAVTLGITLSPVVLGYPLVQLSVFVFGSPTSSPLTDAQDIVLAHDPDAYAAQLAHTWMGRYLKVCLACVEQSGAAVIKLLQWAGSRPDLFGHDFCAIFSQLQDHTTPHSWKHTQRIVEQALGKNWKEQMELMEIKGSGCIGQVYRGRVRVKRNTDQPQNKSNDDEWQQVAVKVLHPNVEQDIDADLDLMRVTVRALQYVPFNVFGTLKWLNLEGIVEEFADLLKMQLDLRQEARNLERFNENFEHDPMVVFPKLVPGYPATKHMLVETYCEGIPILQFAREHAHERETLKDMCFSAIRAVCQMIFLDNFMHGASLLS